MDERLLDVAQGAIGFMPDEEGLALYRAVQAFAVMVREQDVGQRQSALVDRAQQRLDRPAGVHHHGGASVLVGHHVGVGQELIVHGALEDHPDLTRPRPTPSGYRTARARPAGP